MKKNIKNLSLAILVISFSLFAGLINVNAKIGETLTIDNKRYIQTGFGTRTEAKFHTTRGFAWCITPHKTGVNQGAVLKYSRQETKGGLLYLLEKAGTSDTQYLETQLALWIYDSNYLPIAYGQNSSSPILQNAKKLAAEASQHTTYRVVPSISLNTGGNTILSLARNGENYYYRTNEMTANLKNASTYTVALENAPYGTYIVNSNGNASTTFKSGEKFVVRVPEKSVNGNVRFNIIVKTTGIEKFVERYSPNNQNQQEVIILRQENVSVSAKQTVTISPSKKYCKIFNGRYYGSNGTIVSAEDYKKQCVHTCTYYNGNYYGLNNTIVSHDQYQNECVHTCTQYNGNYYGLNGTVVSEATYRKQCIHTCTKFNGNYYGQNNTIVSYDQYKKECVHTCTKYNGNYYGLNNTIVSYDQYKKECVHTCTEYNGNYYGSNSTIVSAEDYRKQCVHTCTKYNGNYYGLNNTIVSYDQYKKECVHTCTEYNGNYYGSNSTIVSAEDYQNQCIHTCTEYNGNYYGINNTIVSADEYRKQCIHTCSQYNGNYYGLNNTIVSYDQYKKECIHTCTEYNGNYYGSNSTIVTEADYRKQCQGTTITSVPSTGTNSDITNIIAGLCMILGGTGITIGYRKEKNNIR